MFPKFATAVLALTLTAIPAALCDSAAAQSACSEPLKQCLFSDGAGCSATCPADCACVTRSAKCVLGWGVDASCICACGGPIIIVQ